MDPDQTATNGQIRLLLMEQPDMSLHCLTKRLLKHFSRQLGALKVNPCHVDSDIHFLAQGTNSEELIKVKQNFVIQRLNTEYNV